MYRSKKNIDCYSNTQLKENMHRNAEEDFFVLLFARMQLYLYTSERYGETSIFFFSFFLLQLM